MYYNVIGEITLLLFLQAMYEARWVSRMQTDTMIIIHQLTDYNRNKKVRIIISSVVVSSRDCKVCESVIVFISATNQQMLRPGVM